MSYICHHVTDVFLQMGEQVCQRSRKYPLAKKFAYCKNKACVFLKTTIKEKGVADDILDTRSSWNQDCLDVSEIFKEFYIKIFH